MLGPSDVRKNVRHSLLPGTTDFAALDYLLGHRFTNGAQTATLRDQLRSPLGIDPINALSVRKQRILTDSVEGFAAYADGQNGGFSLPGVALANVFFAGLYLRYADFNRAVSAFVDYFGIRNRVLNLTDGKDMKLVGLTGGHRLLPNEAAICTLPAYERIRDIFLTHEYLSARDSQELTRLGAGEQWRELNARSRLPRMNQEVRDAIASADAIVYWAGTQHSSLYPSYLTDGLAEAIAASKANKKILLTNILKDNDICNETAFSLVEKFFWFMSRKGSGSSSADGLVTDMLLNHAHGERTHHVLPLGAPRDALPAAAIRIDRWSDSRGKHDVEKVLRLLAA
jgi:2-phospho-L-lactate transferase/gluconeogenesis factor (CofD/UPF0052 family)